MDSSNLVIVTCNNMRSWGRQALAGNWSTAVLGTLLMSLLMSLPVVVFVFLFDSATMENVSNIYTLLVSGPLTLGYTAFILAIFRRKSASPLDIFNGFERFGKALGLMIVMNVFIFLWTLLLIIPGIIATYRYAMAFYILVDRPEMGILEILDESKRLMMGNKLKLFLLHLSFFGWAILAALTMGIGFFWLSPYITAATSGFYEVANGNLRPYYPTLSPDTPETGEPKDEDPPLLEDRDQ